MTSSPYSLAIIGTAGRNRDAAILAADPLFYVNKMLAAARKVAELTGATHLISGGAAWADHTAVLLYLSKPDHFTLTVELPAPLEPQTDGSLRYRDLGMKDFKRNPGGTCNFYHDPYLKALSPHWPLWSPYKDFACISGVSRVRFRVTHGLHERNACVANADHLLAMTFGDGHKVKDGGTKLTTEFYMARRSGGKSFHLDLGSMKLFTPAEV